MTCVVRIGFGSAQASFIHRPENKCVYSISIWRGSNWR